MKIQLTPKETRKLTAGISLIDAALAKYPTPGWVLKNTSSISHKIEVQEDGSSQIEIHEKSFSTFLDAGTEALIQIGQLAKASFAKLCLITKEFNAEMEDADTSISARGTSMEEKDTEVSTIILQGIDVPTEAVPYPIRLSAAVHIVKSGGASSEEAAKTFLVKEEDIVNAISA